MATFNNPFVGGLEEIGLVKRPGLPHRFVDKESHFKTVSRSNERCESELPNKLS
jgi:hypothetical protein